VANRKGEKMWKLFEMRTGRRRERQKSAPPRIRTFYAGFKPGFKSGNQKEGAHKTREIKRHIPGRHENRGRELGHERRDSNPA